MHVPPHFASSDPRALLASLVTATLPHLVTVNEEGLVATPVPMLYEPDSGDQGLLRGHLARANPQWRTAANGVDALVIVLGPDAYVSPNWYPSRHADARVVPTWNYQAVHAYGRLVIHDDAEWKLDLVRRLTDAHESGFAKPWSLDDAAPGYVEARLAAIVGFEVPVTRIVAKEKLSQNRPSDTESVAAALTAGGDVARAVSAAMRRR